jgi:CHAT domain-containing protein
MQAAQLALKRQRAMLDFEEGRVPDAETALGGIIQSLREANDTRAHYELGRALLDRATVRSFAHRWQEALGDLNACAHTAQHLSLISSRSLLVNVYQQRAKLYATPFSPMFDPQAARHELSRLSAMGFTNWWTEATAADLAYQEGDWEAAAQRYGQVAQALSQEGWARGVAASRLRAGRAFLEQGNLREAAPEIEAALAFFEQYGPADLLAGAKIHAARLRLAQGMAEPAWELAYAALHLVEATIRQFRALFDQQRFVLDKLAYYQHAFAIALATRGETGLWRAWEVAERAKSFYLCQLVANADVPLFEGVDTLTLGTLKDLEAQLDAYEARLYVAVDTTAQASLQEDLARLSKARDGLLNSLMRANPRWAALRTPPPLDLQQALLSLPQGWAGLAYFWQENPPGSVLHLFFARPGDRPQHCSVAWSQEEMKALELARRRLQQASPKQLPLLDLLPSGLSRKVLPGNLEAWLHGQERLLVSPHGRLRMLPLHALELASGARLIERAAVQYIPTLALLPLGQQRQWPPRVLLMGCEQDSFGGAKLPEVPQEITSLQAIWEAQPQVAVTLCQFAPETRFGGQVPELERWGEFGLLHFACHGVFDPERPLDAALRLGREAVRASELFAVKLNVALASLSACHLGGQTDHHDSIDLVGDEWLGLFIPLLYAGAQTMLVSLWLAMSDEAAAFMQTLHRALSQGSCPAEAFRLAVASVQDNPETHWANWYLAGLPTASLSFAQPSSREEPT